MAKKKQVFRLRKCRLCGGEFQPSGTKSIYCSDLCRFSVRYSINHESGCWEWTGPLNGSGYGSVFSGGRNIGSHVFSYQKFIGDVPSGMCVCHKCDNRLCVNPDHLFCGTHSENAKDMVEKGRCNAPAGSRSASAKLSAGQIAMAFRMAAGGEPLISIARQFGVDRKTVLKLLRGNSWKGEASTDASVVSLLEMNQRKWRLMRHKKEFAEEMRISREKFGLARAAGLFSVKAGFLRSVTSRLSCV